MPQSAALPTQPPSTWFPYETQSAELLMVPGVVASARRNTLPVMAQFLDVSTVSAETVDVRMLFPAMLHAAAFNRDRPRAVAEAWPYKMFPTIEQCAALTVIMKVASKPAPASSVLLHMEM